jgi:exopolysaccharide biosynthesis predicted pyruvyltransferase EpsI
MEIDIDTFLRGFSGQHVHYLPNPGNAGDSVIAAATYQCFRRRAIRITIPHPDRFDPAGKTLFYGGGGNLIGTGTYAYAQVSRFHKDAGHLVILSQTVKDVDDLIRSFGGNVTVICRERVSYDYVRSFDGPHRTLLAHDMAFSLDPTPLLEGVGRAEVLASYIRAVLRGQGRTRPGNLARILLGRPRGAVPDRAALGPALSCFRLDGERTDIAVPSGNVDLSAVFALGVGPEAVANHAASRLLSTLHQFDEIRTNRLHIAISSAILGKAVKFYSNNYYKCRAVYEYSMQDRFPNVQWMG